MSEFKTHTTPNPNSLKITAAQGGFPVEQMQSFRSPEEATDHPLGYALLTIDGVTDVLLLPDFVTVSKSNGASWDDLLPAITDVLTQHVDGA